MRERELVSAFSANGSLARPINRKETFSILYSLFTFLFLHFNFLALALPLPLFPSPPLPSVFQSRLPLHLSASRLSLTFFYWFIISIIYPELFVSVLHSCDSRRWLGPFRFGRFFGCAKSPMNTMYSYSH